MTQPSETAAPRRPVEPGQRHVALTVEVRTDVDLCSDDAIALDGLIESRPEVGVFLSRAWLSGYLGEPQPGVEPMIVLLRDGATLRAMVPLEIRRGLTHTRVGLLGGGRSSDRVDLLAAPGYEAGCSDVLVSWLDGTFGRRGWVFELRDVPLDSPLWGALERADVARSPVLAVQPRQVHTLPWLDLAEFWSPLVDAQSQLWDGASIERNRRQLARRGTVTLTMVEQPDDAVAAFVEMTTLIHVRWRDVGVTSSLDDDRAQRFHRHVLPRLLAERRLRMMRMSVGARVVGVLYALSSGGWWGAYAHAYDRRWAGRIHLGRLVYAEAIDRAAREGATEFDFLKGAERVKYLWPVRTRGTLNADVYSSGVAAQLHRAGSAARDTAAALVKCAGRLFAR